MLCFATHAPIQVLVKASNTFSLHVVIAASTQEIEVASFVKGINETQNVHIFEASVSQKLKL